MKVYRTFKGAEKDTMVKYSKKKINIKTYMVTSIGELLIV